MKGYKSTALLGAGLLLFSAGAFAQQRTPRFKDRGLRHDRQGRLLLLLKARQEALNLTDEQLTQIKNLAQQREEQMVLHRNEMNLLQLELRKLKREPENLDYNKILNTLDQISAKRNAMQVEGMKHQEQISKILTPEQKEALKNINRGRLSRRAPMRTQRFSRTPRLRSRIKW